VVRPPRNDAEIDRQFVEYVRTGDPDALGDVFDACAPRLLLLAQRLLGEREEAEDLVQRVFLEVIRSSERFEAGRRVVPWLTTILVRRAANARIRRPRDRSVSDDDLDALAGREVDPARTAAEREYAEAVAAAVEGLPEPYRQTLTLRLVHGLTPAQIASALGRPLGTVHAQLSRGLERLRPRLTHLAILASGCGLSDGLDAMFAVANLRTSILSAAAETTRTTASMGLATSGGLATWSLVGLLAMTNVKIWTLAGALGVLGLVCFPWEGSRDGGTGVLGDRLDAGSGPLADAVLPNDRTDTVRAPVAGAAAASEGTWGGGEQAIEEADRAPAELVVLGRCVDDLGAPLAGIDVTMTASGLPRRIAGSTAPSRRLEASGKTAEDGTFSLRIEEPVDEAEGWALRCVGEAVVPCRIENRRGDVGDVVLDRAAILRVVVVSTSAGPEAPWKVVIRRDDAASAELGHVSLGQGRQSLLTTDAPGRSGPSAPLVPGLWRVDAAATGARVVHPDAFELEPGEQEIALHIEPLPMIVGRLVDDRGEPVRSSVGATGPGIPRVNGWLHYEPTDEDGWFVLRAKEDVDEGTEVVVQVAQHDVHRETRVRLAWGARDAVVRIDRDALLRVVVESPNGSRVEDYLLGVGDDPATLTTYSSMEPMARRLGGFVLSPGLYWLRVCPKDAGLGISEPRRILVEPGETTHRIEVGPCEELLVRVLDAKGQPAPALSFEIVDRVRDLRSLEPGSAWWRWDDLSHVRPSFGAVPRVASRLGFGRTDEAGSASVRRSWHSTVWLAVHTSRGPVWHRVDPDSSGVTVRLAEQPPVQPRLVVEPSIDLPAWVTEACLTRSSRDDGGPTKLRSKRIDGRFVFTQVPHDRWTLRLGGFLVELVDTGSEASILVDGTTETVTPVVSPAALPGRVRLSWNAAAAEGMKEYVIEAPGGQSLIAYPLRDAYRFIELAPGNYWVHLRGSDRMLPPIPSRRVVVLPGREVECVLVD
jgi:RNA polymerase sigma-70 factor (ECF subfamily)